MVQQHLLTTSNTMDTTALDNFEQVLEDGLVKICNSFGLLDDHVLRSPDIEEVWNDVYLKDYVGDAVSNYNQFPDAAIAWAAFLGMGVAYNWDKSWSLHKDDPYQSYYGPNGFDDMDEHILRDILGIKLYSDRAKQISQAFSACAAATQSLIRHEGIEAQTSEGFYILVRAYSVLFRIGASIELKKLGYKRQLIS